MLPLLAGLALATPPLVETSAEDTLDRPEILVQIGRLPRHAHVIHGEEASEADYPMAGAILLEGVLRQHAARSYPFAFFICTGTLIAPDVVLTAAHCLDVEGMEEDLGYPIEEPALVFVREVDVRDFEYFDESARWPRDAGVGHAWVPHPDYDPDDLHYSSLWQDDDIGVIYLDEPLEGELAYLPTVQQGEALREGDPVEVVGWGRRTSEDSELTGVKHMGESWIARIKSWSMQIGEVEEDVRKCHGDSGGPSFIRVDTQALTDLRQVGVTSHAYDATDCAETGGVDTRVDFYLGWLEEELLRACDEGARAWCEDPGLLEAPLPGEDPPGYEKPGLCQSAAPRAPSWLLPFLPLLWLRRRR